MENTMNGSYDKVNIDSSHRESLPHRWTLVIPNDEGGTFKGFEGTEAMLRTVAKFNVSAGIWSNCYLYPPTSDPDKDATHPGNPYGVYTSPNLGGVTGPAVQGWEYHILDE
jgi:hypothetical protein